MSRRILSLVLVGNLYLMSAAIPQLSDAVDFKKFQMARLARELENFGIDASTEEGLTAGLVHEEPLARATSLLAFAEIGDLSTLLTIRPLLTDPSKMVWSSAAIAMGRICERETGYGPVDYHQRWSDSARDAAALELGRYGIRSVDGALAQGITHPNEAARVASLRSLGAAGDLAALESVVQVAMESSGETREAALRAVDSICRAGAIEVARAKYEEAEYEGDRFGIAELLARIGDPRKYAEVLQVLEQPDSVLFGRAVQSVRFFSGYTITDNGQAVDWTKRLEGVISERNVHPFTRQSAVTTMYLIAPQETLAHIRKVLPEETDAQLRQFMEYLLAQD